MDRYEIREVVRERRRIREEARQETKNSKNITSTTPANEEFDSTEKSVIAPTKWQRLKGFLFRSSKKVDKKKVKKEKKNNFDIRYFTYFAGTNSFKPIMFTLYIILSISVFSYFFYYIINQESKYETKNKKLIVASKKVKEEIKVEAPLILNSDDDDDKVLMTMPIDDDLTYTLDSVLPLDLKEDRFNLSAFLGFIASNRKSFCTYAEQSRLAYMLANNEVREYYSTKYPLNNNRINYNDCMSTNIWGESELFILYQNLYDDFIKTQTEDDVLFKKLLSAKQYLMKTNFNPVRDLPSFLSGSLMTENNFDNLLKGKLSNQYLLCRYSKQFSKSYDRFVSKRSGSLRPISNCYASNINLQEAYVQYVFYYNYIQSNSKDVNASDLQSSLIPNFP